MSRGPKPANWETKVGEVIHGRKEIIEFCGMYRAPGGGTKALFRWRCLRCLKEQGPSQYNDILRYSQASCCSKSSKYGQTRWGFRHITGGYMRSLHSSAMKRSVEFSVTSEDLYVQWEKQNGCCAYTVGAYES